MYYNTLVLWSRIEAFGRYLICGAARCRVQQQNDKEASKTTRTLPELWFQACRPATVTLHLLSVRLCALVYFFAFLGVVIDGPIMWAVLPTVGGWSASERIWWCKLGMACALVSFLLPRIWPALMMCWPIWHYSHTNGNMWFGFGWDPMMDDVGFLAILLSVTLTLYDVLIEETVAMQLGRSLHMTDVLSENEIEHLVESGQTSSQRGSGGSSGESTGVRRRAAGTYIQEGLMDTHRMHKFVSGLSGWDGDKDTSGTQEWMLCNPAVGWSVMAAELILTLGAFRLFSVAGILKMHGSSCWHDHTCLYSHFYTQPMPNPLAWYFHNWTSPSFKRFMQWYAIDFSECIAPYLLLGFLVSTGPLGFIHMQIRRSPHVPMRLLAMFPARLVGSLCMISLLLGMWVSGNYAFLHPLSMVGLLASCGTARCVPVMNRNTSSLGLWYRRIVPWAVVIFAVVALLPSWNTVSFILDYKYPGSHIQGWGKAVHGFLNRQYVVQQARSFNLGMDHYNYAYFAGAVESRSEWVLTVQVSGKWLEVDVPCKVGSVDRAPCFTSPLHRRFAWQLWFPFGEQMFDFQRFFELLCNGDAVAWASLEWSPALQHIGNVTAIAKQAFDYQFTGSGHADWWTRTPSQMSEKQTYHCKGP